MKVSLPQFEEMFGGHLDAKTISDIARYDWHYEAVDAQASNKIILDLLQMAEKRSFSVAGENVERWEKGWTENLEEFRRTKDLSALTPKYLRPSQYVRLNSQFIEPADPMFEANWYAVFRGWFARRHLAQFDWIFEFGCGSGQNIAFLAQEFPDKTIVGFDWCEASADILEVLALPNVRSGRFDFFEPDLMMMFPPNSAVITMGALEQTGLRWRPFLGFLNRAMPARCFHIEPIVEWYDPTDLIDHTAIKVHGARGFWRGFVNEIEPVWTHRTKFGGMSLEGYSQFAWSP